MVIFVLGYYYYFFFLYIFSTISDERDLMGKCIFAFATKQFFSSFLRFSNTFGHVVISNCRERTFLYSFLLFFADLSLTLGQCSELE